MVYFSKRLARLNENRHNISIKKYTTEYKHLRPEVQATLILPFRSDNKLQFLNDICTEAHTERGCPEGFWRELEHLCELPMVELERLVPSNVQDALRLYGTLKPIFDP